MARPNEGLTKNDSTLILSVGQLFESEFMPYARKFAEASYPVNQRSANLTDAQYRIYMQKAKFLTTGFLDAGAYRSETLSNGLSEDYVYSIFESSYRNNFPGLDFTFFEKMKQKLGSEKK